MFTANASQFHQGGLGILMNSLFREQSMWVGVRREWASVWHAAEDGIWQGLARCSQVRRVFAALGALPAPLGFGDVAPVLLLPCRLTWNPKTTGL